MKFKHLLDAANTAPLTAEQIEELNALNTGFDVANNLRYTHVSATDVRAEVYVDDRHLQPMGLVHGGVYCSVAESVGSVAGICAARAVVVGVNNNTDFVRSVRSGVIVAQATPLHLGRTTQLWNIEFTHQGVTVARSTLRTLVLSEQNN